MKIKRPFFDKEGNWYLPKDIKFGGEMKPKLKPREYICYLLLISINPDKNSNFWKTTFGSRSTKSKIIKSLISKGYESNFYRR